MAFHRTMVKNRLKCTVLKQHQCLKIALSNAVQLMACQSFTLASSDHQTTEVDDKTDLGLDFNMCKVSTQFTSNKLMYAVK